MESPPYLPLPATARLGSRAPFARPSPSSSIPVTSVLPLSTASASRVAALSPAVEGGRQAGSNLNSPRPSGQRSQFNRPDLAVEEHGYGGPNPHGYSPCTYIRIHRTCVYSINLVGPPVRDGHSLRASRRFGQTDSPMLNASIPPPVAGRCQTGRLGSARLSGWLIHLPVARGGYEGERESRLQATKQPRSAGSPGPRRIWRRACPSAPYGAQHRPSKPRARQDGQCPGLAWPGRPVKRGHAPSSSLARWRCAALACTGPVAATRASGG